MTQATLPPLVEIALSLLVGVAWSAVLVALGARARTALSIDIPTSFRLPTDYLLGAWLAASAMLALGLTGQLRATPVLALVSSLAAVGRWSGNQWALRPALPSAAIAGTLLPIALAPPFFYDALVYHLGLPWQALLEGGLHAHPENLFSTFPPLAQLVFAVPLAVGVPLTAPLASAPAVLHLLSFVVAGCAVSALARQLGASGRLAALAGAAVVVLPSSGVQPGSVPVAALPAAEGFVIAAVVTAVGLLVDDQHPRAAIVLGLLLGVASATRLQGVSWSLLVFVAAAVRWRSGRQLTTIVVGWAAGSAPWWLKNAVLLGDPLAPIGWHREGVDTLWRDAASRLSLVTNGDIATIVSLPGVAVGALCEQPIAALILVLAVVMAIESGDSRRRTLVALIAGGIIIWTVTGILPRFLAPTLGLLWALAAASAAPPTSSRLRRMGPLVPFLLATSLALGVAEAVATMVRAGPLDLMLDRSAATYGRLLHNNPMRAFAAAGRLHLPPDARVLFVGEARVFPFPIRFVAPCQHDVSPLRALLEDEVVDDVPRRLRELGFSHLLYASAELERLRHGYPIAPWPDAEDRQRFDALLLALSPPILDRDGLAIFALDR